MPEDIPIHDFDSDRAGEYRPRRDVVKTAILVHLADASPSVTLRAPFGDELMRGDFYIVSSPEGSYGAAQAEFEAMHEQVAPDRWVKRAHVEAYRADMHCRIETQLADGTQETSVVAEPGDWIVRQLHGEVMVVKPNSFEERYELES